MHRGLELVTQGSCFGSLDTAAVILAAKIRKDSGISSGAHFGCVCPVPRD